MSKNYTRFTLGDTVKLKRNIGTVLAGTIGVIVRADDDGQLWLILHLIKNTMTGVL